MALINCIECNAQISDKAKICPKCGAPVFIKETVKCFECGTELDKKTKVCSNCGAGQEVIHEVKKGLSEPPKKKSKGLLWTLISIAILALILIVIAINNKNSGNSPSSSGKQYSTPELPREKTPEELKQELFDKERQTPLEYLTANIKLDTKVPLFGTVEYESNVTVSNSATMATFKDVVYEIQFLTKTNALLGTVRDTLYDYISPKGSKSKRIKVVLPSGTTNYAVKIISCK